VVQVQSGREDQVRHVIERACAEADAASDGEEQLLDECFCPRYQTQTKVRGEWCYVERSLLPGYVIAVTRQSGRLAHLLRGVSEFTRLLAVGEAFVPLSAEERAWMERFTKPGERTIPMSFAYRKGDALVVTEGPLKGMEGVIERINRKKSLAYVQMKVGGKKVTTTVGLGIVGEHEGNSG
jgi:transcriptional antiterminator NusG